MKKILTISLVSLILIVSMSNSVVFLSFKIQQSEIARTICVNKDKPKLHCEGKCVLHQRLTENNDRQQSSSPFSRFDESLRLTLFFQMPAEPIAKLPNWAYKHTFHYKGLRSQSSEVPFLHPPEFFPVPA